MKPKEFIKTEPLTMELFTNSKTKEPKEFIKTEPLTMELFTNSKTKDSILLSF